MYDCSVTYARCKIMKKCPLRSLSSCFSLWTIFISVSLVNCFDARVTEHDPLLNMWKLKNAVDKFSRYHSKFVNVFLLIWRYFRHFWFDLLKFDITECVLTQLLWNFFLVKRKIIFRKIFIIFGSGLKRRRGIL